jgi:hypothetical protein
LITIRILSLGEAVDMAWGQDNWARSIVTDLYSWGACSLGFSAIDEHGVKREGAYMIEGIVPIDPNWRSPLVPGKDGVSSAS